MEDDSDFIDYKAHVLARLAALQRLKDELPKKERSALARSIDKMIHAEASTLRNLRSRLRASIDLLKAEPQKKGERKGARAAGPIFGVRPTRPWGGSTLLWPT